MTARFTQFFAAAAVSLCLLPSSGFAQANNDQTLADIRQDLTVLFVEMQRLRRELSTTGAPSPAIGGTSVMDRIDSVEGELQRLTGKIEQLEFRIDSIVKDGTNRIGDLEFRLVELKGGDLSNIAETSTLGGGATPAIAAMPVPSQGSDAGSTQLAMGEQADFNSAEALLTAGDGAGAAEQFALFTQNYPGSPLEGQARLKQGEAHEASGDTREAARAYLDAYSRDPASDIAPEALFRLGRSLGRLGKVSEACVTLAEVNVRHAGNPAARSAQTEMSTLSCS
ncbi:tetratricopeptide repeat protein [Planktotalea sp.]|uniref:tetratricopeptide repeat protein n=1 Tax=Planktotalea sp. TaxID=2029877 RepID=UPI0025D209A7|nr:tetratricopeptide repeat protein [Planktotalea sp.]